MELLPFIQWCEGSWLGSAIRTSPWAFAVIESVHLLALAAIGGAVLIVDLRLLGFGLRDQPISRIARDAFPWLIGSLAIMLITGIGLFLSEATKCYYSTPFWVKMTTLVVATLFAYTIRRRVAFAGEGQFGGTTRVIVALMSIALWFTVAASGRWIGFSG
jgi:hypothetical protein